VNDTVYKPTYWAQVLTDGSVSNRVAILTNDIPGCPVEVMPIFKWEFPQHVHHLHLGTYNNRRQLTVIADGCSYSMERKGDELGVRICSGTPDEMYQMMLDYANML
jgi:hypothetical protein